MTVRARARPGGWTCEVEVEHAGERTRHTVRVSAGDVARYATGDEAKTVEDLVARSFDFLLEREPAGSILRDFDLSVIRRYFPEFDRTFRR